MLKNEIQQTVTDEQQGQIGSKIAHVNNSVFEDGIDRQDKEYARKFLKASFTECNVNGVRVRAQIFFIPVIFKPTDTMSSLGTHIAGSKLIANALSSYGGATSFQECSLVSRLIPHSEIMQLNTSGLTKLLKFILNLGKSNTGELKGSAQDESPLPTLNYLIGAVYSPIGESLTINFNHWDRVRNLACNLLAFQDGAPGEVNVPILLRPMSYQDAVIEGTLKTVEMLKTVIADDLEVSDDHMQEKAQVDVFFNRRGEPSLVIRSNEISADVDLCIFRMGNAGVKRVIANAISNSEVVKTNRLMN